MRPTAAAVFLVAAGLGNPAFACGRDPYLGEICAFAFNYCPYGYVEAAGQQLPIHSNGPLFSLTGTNFGGDGKASFNLPDLRGRELVGANPEGANGRSEIYIGEEVAAKGGANSANAQGQAVAVKFCVAVMFGHYPNRE